MPNANDTSPAMTADLQRIAQLARLQTGKLMKKLPLLGSVSWLMLASAPTRHALLSDLEWRVMPPLMVNQAKIYLRDEMPAAYVSWACLSADVAKRFRLPPHRLSPGEWNCGDQVWLVDLVAPFGGIQEVLQDLRLRVMPGRTIHQLAPADTDQAEAEIFAWPPLGPEKR